MGEFILNQIYEASNMQSTESKKEDFRKYLEKGGVIDQLTQVLVGLYEEPDKPDNAIEYIKKFLGSPTDLAADELKQTHQRLQDEVTRLEQQNEDLKRQL